MNEWLTAKALEPARIGVITILKVERLVTAVHSNSFLLLRRSLSEMCVYNDNEYVCVEVRLVVEIGPRGALPLVRVLRPFRALTFRAFRTYCKMQSGRHPAPNGASSQHEGWVEPS